jgi:hypothetical protein
LLIEPGDFGVPGVLSVDPDAIESCRMGRPSPPPPPLKEDVEGVMGDVVVGGKVEELEEDGCCCCSLLITDMMVFWQIYSQRQGRANSAQKV